MKPITAKLILFIENLRYKIGYTSYLLKYFWV